MKDQLYIDREKLEKQFLDKGFSSNEILSIIEVIERELPFKYFTNEIDIEIHNHKFEKLGDTIKLMSNNSFVAKIGNIDSCRIWRIKFPEFNLKKVGQGSINIDMSMYLGEIPENFKDGK